jgi:hypothetical protein
MIVGIYVIMVIYSLNINAKKKKKSQKNFLANKFNNLIYTYKLLEILYGKNVVLMIFFLYLIIIFFIIVVLEKIMMMVLIKVMMVFHILEILIYMYINI